MNCSKIWKFFFLCAIYLNTISCGLAQTITPTTPVIIPTTDSPEATSTPEPKKSTPTPIVVEANATFSGFLEISRPGKNASADSGRIEFVTSTDGLTIVSMSYTLVNGECKYEKAGVKTTIIGSGKSTLYFKNPIPINNGKFSFNLMKISGSGTFFSPSEASGMISISKEETMNSPNPLKFTCDYGIWDWEATEE